MRRVRFLRIPHQTSPGTSSSLGKFPAGVLQTLSPGTVGGKHGFGLLFQTVTSLSDSIAAEFFGMGARLYANSGAEVPSINEKKVQFPITRFIESWPVSKEKRPSSQLSAEAAASGTIGVALALPTERHTALSWVGIAASFSVHFPVHFRPCDNFRVARDPDTIAEVTKRSASPV